MAYRANPAGGDDLFTKDTQVIQYPMNRNGEINSITGEALETTRPSYVECRDVFDPSCMEELSAKLKANGGKAFFLIHPFYLESTWYQGHLRGVAKGQDADSELGQFIHKAGELLPKLSKAGTPIIILQEIGYLGERRLEDADLIKAQYDKLTGYLQEVTTIDPKQVFVIYTERGGPAPLRARSEDALSLGEIVAERMGLLKQCGLKVGVVAGREFKPSEGRNYEYWASADNPDYGWGKTADKTHGGWLLKDYYDKLREGKPGLHPFQVIRPDQCVGEFLRMLAYNDIRPAITNMTYPYQIKTASNYEPQGYDGRTVFVEKDGVEPNT